VICHEVGHTLGLRHNFRASTLYSADEIHAQSNVTRRVSASVMDYIGPVVSEHPSSQGAYFNEGVGVYDKWCIKYGYSDLQGQTLDEEYSELLEIAGESDSRRELWRGDDRDSSYANDPYVRRYDITSDPPKYCQSQVRMTHRMLLALADFSVKADPVWHRQFVRRYNLALSSIHRLWYYCGVHQVRFIHGLTYERSNVRSISKPVALDVRLRALEQICRLISDVDVAMPPMKVMQQAAFYVDNYENWGGGYTLR